MGDLPSKIGLYRIVRLLGEGGMGAVFEAVHETIERRVAIKVLHPEFARNSEVTARFFNEARAVNLIAHPGLVQISDYGQQPDGTSYIVMEFLEGASLSKRMQQAGGKLPSSDVINLGWQIADSLAATHEKGIIHRDLKPDNVMVVPDPHMSTGERTKLLDFGIAKVSEQGKAPRLKTRVGQVMGTPVYMSPEQCAGGSGVDEKTDVYSLGVMLFEMLSGRPPFQSDSDGPGNVLGMHMFVAPPLLRELAPKTPPQLAELVQKLLDKKKEARPTMHQVAATLERLAEQLPAPKRSSRNDAILAASVETSDETILVGRRRSRPSTLGSSAAQTVQRRPQLQRLAATLGAIFCIAGIVVWLVMRPSKHTAAKNPASEDKTTPAPAAVEKRVTLHVVSEPVGAQVIRISDSQVLGITPWETTQPASAGQLQLRLQLEGHESLNLSLATDMDQRTIVHLRPYRGGSNRTPGKAGEKHKIERSKPGSPIPDEPVIRAEQPRIID